MHGLECEVHGTRELLARKAPGLVVVAEGPDLVNDAPGDLGPGKQLLALRSCMQDRR